MNAGEVVARADSDERHVLVLSNGRFHAAHAWALVTPLFSTPDGAAPDQGALYTLSPYPAYLTPKRIWSVPVTALGDPIGRAEDEAVFIMHELLTDGLRPE